MTFINSIINLSEPFNRIYRNIEKKQNKVIRNSWSIKFNKTCIKEETLPNYTNVKFNKLNSLLVSLIKLTVYISNIQFFSSFFNLETALVIFFSLNL